MLMFYVCLAVGVIVHLVSHAMLVCFSELDKNKRKREDRKYVVEEEDKTTTTVFDDE